MSRETRRAPETTISRLTLLQASKAADAAWMAEVVAVFGEREARMARFQDRANGEPGTRLRELYDKFVAASEAYTSTS
ncbi:hypothetical protein U91I_00748 [alpha proteobacterium U9-1i]|nr:hypothetical protein U91I_00748 [alpha proteobacterium U9-1i]